MRHGTGEVHLGGGLETARTGSRPSETAGTGSRSSAARPGRGEGKRARAAARRPRDAAATREALLAAGTELFAERGYDGVPVWSIARAAGVNKAMISYHFGGKLNLYQTIADD